MTEYIVLAHLEGAWHPVYKDSHRSSRAAISAYLDGREENVSGEYVAVPARSWRPVSVKVETKTALKFS